MKQSQFIKKHLQTLLDSGVYMKTLEEKDGWGYLLAHGECFYTSWSLDELEYRKLFQLEEIVAEYVGHFSSDTVLLSMLRKRIKRLNDQLDLLNYSKDWLTTGLLKLDKLKEQVAEYEKGEDLNTEHYRYAAFKDNIDNQDSFDDEVLFNLLQLASQDEDPVMAGSVVVSLLRKKGLTDKQFHVVKEALMGFGDWTNKVIEREIAKREKNG